MPCDKKFPPKCVPLETQITHAMQTYLCRSPADRYLRSCRSLQSHIVLFVLALSPEQQWNNKVLITFRHDKLKLTLQWKTSTYFASDGSSFSCILLVTKSGRAGSKSKILWTKLSADFTPITSPKPVILGSKYSGFKLLEI